MDPGVGKIATVRVSHQKIITREVKRLNITLKVGPWRLAR